MEQPSKTIARISAALKTPALKSIKTKNDVMRYVKEFEGEDVSMIPTNQLQKDFISWLKG